MSVLVAFSVTPLGVGDGVGELVAEAVRVVRASGLANRTDAMFTTVEGDSWDEVMAVVKDAVEAVHVRAPRTSTVIGSTGTTASRARSTARSRPSNSSWPE